jgi:hypothetical protein
VARAPSGAIVDQTCHAVAASCTKISCTKGGAARCRGLISISQVEERQRHDLLAQPRP